MAPLPPLPPMPRGGDVAGRIDLPSSLDDFTDDELTAEIERRRDKGPVMLQLEALAAAERRRLREALKR